MKPKSTVVAVSFLFSTLASADDSYNYRSHAASNKTLEIIEDYFTSSQPVMPEWWKKRANSKRLNQCEALKMQFTKKEYDYISPTIWGESWNSQSLVKFKPFMLDGKISTRTYVNYPGEKYIPQENIALWILDLNQDGNEEFLVYGQKWLDSNKQRGKRGVSNYDLYDYDTLKHHYFVHLEDPYSWTTRSYRKIYSGLFKIKSKYYVIVLNDHNSSEPSPYLYFNHIFKANDGKTWFDSRHCTLRLDNGLTSNSSGTAQTHAAP